nr:hypothetical protein [Tanacetum cinerariifolium]
MLEIYPSVTGATYTTLVVALQSVEGVRGVAEATGSMAYVIYRVEANNNAGFCSCLIGWETPWNRLSLDTHAFCDVYDDGKTDDNEKIYKNLNESARQVAIRKKEMWMTANIESDTSPLFEAHFNLDAATEHTGCRYPWYGTSATGYRTTRNRCKHYPPGISARVYIRIRISEALHPELPGPEDRMVDFPEEGVPDYCGLAYECSKIRDASREYVFPRGWDNTKHTPYPNPEITRSTTLLDRIEPHILPRRRDMDLFNLICAPNPTKVKTGSRPRAAYEVPLLTVTANRVIEIEDPATATNSSGVPSTIERSPLDFANENHLQQSTGPEDQEAAAPEVSPPDNVTTMGIAPEAGPAERVAATGPPVVIERRKRIHDGVDTNAPSMVLRRDHADPRPTKSTRGRKSLAAIELGMGSNHPILMRQSTPVDVSDPDPLCFADPQSRPSKNVTQVFPTIVDWRTSALKDGMPAENTYSPDVVIILNTHRTPIQKQPEALLCLVGLSRRYYLGDEVYPTFLHDDDRGGRPGSYALGGATPDNVTTMGIAPEAGPAERVAARGPFVVIECHKRSHDGVDTNAPPKVLRRDHADPRPTKSTRRGKSLATIELGMGSTRPIPAPQGTPVDVNDPNPLSFVDPQSRPSTDVTQELLQPEIQNQRIHHLPPWSGLLRAYMNGCLLDVLEACQDLVDHIAPPGYFSELRHLHNDEFLKQYNVNLARQVAMRSQMRLRFEQEAKLLRKSIAQVACRDKRIQARENELKNLETLLEAKEDMRKTAENKGAELSTELETMCALFSDLQVSNNRLSHQVSSLQEQVIGKEKLKAAFEEFKQYEDNRVLQRCAEMDARLDALSIDFDEELYPHMLTVIASRRVEHGKAKVDLEAIEAYDPKAEAKYIGPSCFEKSE